MQTYSFFERQMAMYTTYHRDWRNRLTHFFGVPAIIFGLMVAMAAWQWQIGGVQLSLAITFAAAVFVMWMVMDVGIALPLVILLLPVLVLAEVVARTGSPALIWGLAGVFFVGGWALQLWGHAYEGRKPALVDNLFQIFVAPLFLTAETIFAMGFRKKLHDNVEAYIREHYPDYALPQDGGRAVSA